ncbi:TolC family protein [Rheinheimera gaetbuli]
MYCIFIGKRLSALVLLVLWLAALNTTALNATELAAKPDILTLQDAAKRLLQQHPQLQVFDWRIQAAAGQQQLSALKPGYELAVSAENLLGSGELAGVKNLELTVALSSVLELGDKRQARMAAVGAEQQLLLAQRQAASLDLLGELTQRFISVLTLQQKQQLADDAIVISEQALQMVSLRVQSGAAPPAEQLRAKVLLHQVQLQRGLLQAELDSSKLALASLWGAQQANFSVVAGDLFALSESADFNRLYQQLLSTPQLAVFAARQRVQQARLERVQSQSAADVRWQLGLMRSQQSGDVGLQAQFSLPLFSAQRNQGALSSAQAELEAERGNGQYELLQLRARLYQAWQSHRYSAMAVRDLQRDIVPALQQALQQTQAAYQRGRYGYSEWLSAWQALLDARLQLVDGASTALSNQAVIEQLSGMAFGVPSFSSPAFSQPVISAAGTSQ